MRTIVNLNADWRFCKTGESPAVFPDDWERVDLPHTWNAADGQDGGNDYWRGTASYEKHYFSAVGEPDADAVHGQPSVESREAAA